MIELVNRHYMDISNGVDITRNSPLGNPWSHMPHTSAKYQVANRSEAIKKYRDYLYKELKKGNPTITKAMEELVERYRKDGYLKLVCACVPSQCHGEVIIEILNQVLEE